MYTNNNQYSDMDIDYAQGNTTTIITQMQDTRTRRSLTNFGGGDGELRRGRCSMACNIKFRGFKLTPRSSTKMLRPVVQT